MINEKAVSKLNMGSSPFLVVVPSTLSEPPLPRPRKDCLLAFCQFPSIESSSLRKSGASVEREQSPFDIPLLRRFPPATSPRSPRSTLCESPSEPRYPV